MVLKSPVDDKDWKTWALNWTFTIIGALILIIVTGVAFMVRDMKISFDKLIASDKDQSVCIAEMRKENESLRRDFDSHIKGNKR